MNFHILYSPSEMGTLSVTKKCNQRISIRLLFKVKQKVKQKSMNKCLLSLSSESCDAIMVIHHGLGAGDLINLISNISDLTKSTGKP